MEAPSGRDSDEKGRVLGIDLGAVRIGVALSNSTRTVALPHAILRRGRDHVADHREIAAVVTEFDVRLVVVGLPLSLSGGDSNATEAVRREIDELRASLVVPVEAVDERLSTTEVLARRREGLIERDSTRRGGRGGRAGPSGSRRARVTHEVDDRAAAVILQSYLDRASGPSMA